MLLVLPEEPRRGKHNFSKKQRWGMVGGPMAWAYGLGMRKKNTHRAMVEATYCKAEGVRVLQKHSSKNVTAKVGVPN